MKRNEEQTPKIAPPVIATANAASGHNGSVTMVRKESTFPGQANGGGGKQKASSAKAPTAAVNGHAVAPAATTSAVPPATTSRRKCLQPKRAVDATLLLTSKGSNSIPTSQEATADKNPTANPDGSENRRLEERDTASPVDGSEFIEVC